MAETALMRLEKMLPEAAYFIEKEVFSREEMKSMMDERRLFEMGINSRSCTLKDFMSYIAFEIRMETERRQRYEALKISKRTQRDGSIVARIHDLFNRCVSKYAVDTNVWLKYIEFCSSSGCTGVLSKIIMRAIKRHPRNAAFRVIAADRELQQGGLISARKLLMRAVRVKTDDQLSIWKQLFKLECSAIHKQVTNPAKGDDASSPSCQAAEVVYRHAMSDLKSSGKTAAFAQFAKEVVETLEMSILGFPEPRDLEALLTSVRAVSA